MAFVRTTLAAAGLLLACSAHAAAHNSPAASQPRGMQKAAIVGAINVVSAASTSPTSHQVVATATVTGTTDDFGLNDTVCMTVWDDGAQQAEQCQNVPVGTTTTLTFTLSWSGPILDGAPGVGLNLDDPDSGGGSTRMAQIDPLVLTLASPATPVPTLHAWALSLLAATLGALGWRGSKRRPRQA